MEATSVTLGIRVPFGLRLEFHIPMTARTRIAKFQQRTVDPPKVITAVFPSAESFEMKD